MPASLGRMSFNVGPLCTGLISTSLSLARSRHSVTLSFALWTSTKLLHHLNVLYMLSGTIICCLCNLPTSFLRVPAVHMPPFLGVPDMIS